MEEVKIETHPLKPFLPSNSKLLMLGSFPPQKKRWSMDFYYPNLQNDMWRIFGIIFFENKQHFISEDNKSFNKELIIDFLNKKGIALYDTGSIVKRLKDNASDKYLEIVQQTDIKELITHIPQCMGIAATGQKAIDQITSQLEIEEPTIGQHKSFNIDTRTLKVFRMPSSSRAYPLAIEKKATVYRLMFSELGLL